MDVPIKAHRTERPWKCISTEALPGVSRGKHTAVSGSLVLTHTLTHEGHFIIDPRGGIKMDLIECVYLCMGLCLYSHASCLLKGAHGKEMVLL